MHGPHSPSRSPRSFRPDDRAVSPVIGAVLMLVVAVLLLGILQTTAIPSLNAQQEFEHSEGVRADVVGLSATVDRVAAGDHGERAMVDVGFRYPQRLFFVNPPPVSGTLRTAEAGTVTIRNATAAGETGHFWDREEGPRTFETSAVVYDPAYNEYRSAPTTVFEPWAVYGRIDGRTLARTETDLVDGRRISLVALDGRYSRSVASAAGVSVTPTSAPVQSVTVSGDADNPITLTVPTGMRNDTWAELLEGEIDGPGEDDRHVTGFDCRAEPPEPCGELTLTLEPGSYDLRLGAVGFGEARREPEAYLTDVSGNATAVVESGRQRLVVEARDRFDNPVGGVDVTASVRGDLGSVSPASATTDSGGRAVFSYRAPDEVDGTQSVTVAATFGDGRERTVEFDIEVVDRVATAGPGDGTGDGTGGGTGDGTGGTDDSTAADAIGTVAGSVDSANVNTGTRDATFSLRADRPATVVGVEVTTQNELDGRAVIDEGTTVDGVDSDGLPATVDGEFEVAIRIDRNRNLPIREFVDPADADIVVTLQFADGSSRTVGLG